MRRDPGPFATTLRTLRMAAAISQEALAAQSGVSLRAISDLERGERRTPYLHTVDRLADALSLSPADRQALLTAARPGILAVTQAAPPADAGLLPMPLSPFIGRERESDALHNLLSQAHVRLVTVTGPGGVGKTRLALAAARKAAAAFAHGVCFVPLTPIRDPDLVGSAIAHALGLRALGSRSVWELLAAHLRPRHTLLVLDNLEQVLDAAPLVATLLATCPRLTVLTTSRATLHLSGEHDVQVPPLPLPALDVPTTIAYLAGVPAIELFVQRAQEVDPTFALTNDNAAAVAAICQHLDGLPLAIELAAARVKPLPPNCMLARLDRWLPLLTGGPRDQPARLRTMRNAIAWSYDLLAPSEQALFRRLSAFVGGFTLEAAEAVGCDLSADVLGQLTSLIDQSLVRQPGFLGSEPRFGMLETIREFAAEQLVAEGEVDAARAAHAGYVLTLAEHTAAAGFGAQEALWLDRLEAERSNLREAQAWFEQVSKADLALRLAAACYRFWRVRGPVAEGRATMERALALAGDSQTDLRVLVTLFAGELAYVQGIPAADREHLAEGLAQARRIADPAVLAFALNANARVALERGNAIAAETLWEEAISLTRLLDEQSVAFRYGASMLEHMGFLARRRGDLERAATLTTEALAWAERIDFEWSAAMILGSLAAVAREQGHLEQAGRLYRKSLRRIWTQHDRRNFASALFGFALTVAKSGRCKPAAQLYGAAETLLAADETSVPILGRPDRCHVVSLLRSTMGEERFATERAAGEDLSPEQVLALAETIEI